MKILLIFPPLWDLSLSPMLGLPVLSGMLKEDEHDVEIFDINADFMNYVLDKKIIERIENQINILNSELIISKNNNITTQLKENINELLFVKNTLQKVFNKYSDIKEGINFLFQTNSIEIKEIYNVIQIVTRKLFKLYKDFNYVLFKEFHNNIINKIKKYNPELVGFSILGNKPYDWVIKISQELKEQMNVTIVLGGSYLTSRRNKIDKKVFINAVDIFMFGTGELSLKRIANGESLENIPNIMYMDKNNSVRLNKESYNTNYKIYKPNYNGIDFNKYFSPKPFIMLECSRGCYWNKCEFCCLTYCAPYKIKDVDSIIEEIKEYVYKYNINHFFFTVADIHPDYAEEFSRKILENKLNIYYLTSLRLEKEFDYKLIKLMYDAGLRAAIWGVESGSDRILQMYNKGTSVETNARILKDAHNIGIINWALIMTCFPGENISDLMMTKNFLLNNYNSIDTISINEFQLSVNAPMYKHYEQYGLTKSEFDFVESECLYRPPEKILNFAINLKEQMLYLYNRDLNVPEFIFFKILKD